VTQLLEELGGKPNPGTAADKRLKKNTKSSSTIDPEDAVTAVTDTEPVPSSVVDVAPQWSGVLVPEGVATGDGREFAVDSVRWNDPPLPLRWQKEGAHGGDNDVTVQVGLITRVWRDGNNIMGEGHFDLGGPENDDAHEAFRRMGSGTCAGVSIDADDIGAADVEYIFPKSEGETEEDDVLFMLFQAPEKIIFHSARIRAATLCDIPAFTQATLKLLTPDEAALTASALGITFGPVTPHTTATTDSTWDGPANEANLPSPCPIDAARDAYAWVDESMVSDGMCPKSAGRFIHHEISADGSPGAANMVACSAGIGVLHGGRGGTTIPTSDKRGVYDHLARHLRDGGQEPPPFQALETIVAHAWHDEWRPPKSWFEDPNLGQVMPIMVNDQGRVYGHAAQWGQCHLGFMNECVMPPFEDFHSYYRTGEITCDDGSVIAIGTITAGIDHARLTANAAQAKEHYENTDAIVAYVAAGNDKHGIWVAGAIRPDAMASRVQALRGSGQVSPDWRRIGGVLRMVGLLAVNISGYQVPKARSLVAGGQVQSLIVEGMVSVSAPRPDEKDLAKRALEEMRKALTARVHGEG
jgi:hypothetical protein